MDEPQVRAIFERLSGTDAPASRVDVGLARLRGRRRLRLRRAVLSGTPAVAVAVLALSASGLVSVLPHGTHGPHRNGHPATSTPPPATRSFSPLIPYAEFGWLPPGVSLLTGNTGRFSQYTVAGPNAHRATWTLAVIAEGRCNHSSGQILRQLRRGGHPTLGCVTSPGHAGYRWAPQRQAPSVNGHLAFWIDHQIAWEYTRDSWAVVGESGRHVPLHPGLIEKVAAGVLFGAPQPALMFPVQLTGLPAGWRVGSVSFVSDAGALRGRQLVLAGARASRTSQPMVDVSLAGPGSSCYFYPGGQSQHRTINGITAVVTRISAAPGIPATFQVCAAHAHGLSVFISTYGSEHPRAVSIFRDHLRILGPDPSRWTAQPLG
jgi:hypothetical protein